MRTVVCNNFRCYEHQEIAFRPGINLLIGDNSSGKTSCLRACRYVMGTFFAGFSDENTHWMGLGNDDFRQAICDGVIAPEQPIQIAFSFYPEEVENNLWQKFLSNSGEDIHSLFLQKNSKKNSRSLTTGFKPYKSYASELFRSFMGVEEGRLIQRYPLPLLACFTTEDIHTTRKINAEKFKSYNQTPSFGYYECMSGSGFLSYWLKRMLVLQEGNRNLQELEVVRRAIREVLGPEGCNIIRDVEIRPIQKKVYYVLCDGREVEAELLSDGYKRLVYIVTDMAFRCALLNRLLYGEECTARTKGTVLIDEVDLHLHPSLQAKVLRALRRGFPQVQFIVTTHAPMVMTGVESNDDNVVYKLKYTETEGYSIVERETYGMDVSDITAMVLEQTPRDVDVDRQLEELFGLMDEDRNEEASQMLSLLQERYGDRISELAKAEAMLNFSKDWEDD